MSTSRTLPIVKSRTCLVLLGVAGCAPSEAAHHDSTAAPRSNAIATTSSLTATTSAVSYGLKLLQGSSFTLAIPNDAIVDQQVDSLGRPRWNVHSPTQLITAGIGTADTTRFTDARPLYELKISLEKKSAAQSLKAWGDSVVAAHEAVADELDRGESGQLVSVAGTEAYLREPSCGDCGDYIFTFANGERLVEVEYIMDTAEPLAVRKHGIYALLLSTFRWSVSAAAAFR